MRWLTFRHDGAVRHGHVDGTEVVVAGDGDLSSVVAGDAVEANGVRLQLADVEVLAPLLRPGKVVAVAANYQAHVTESGLRERDRATAMPRLFLKPDTAIAGPDEPVRISGITTEFDWEVELAAVIGRPAYRVGVEQALSYVFGYATSNDLSARSLAHGIEPDGEAVTGFFAWLEGKWLDGSAPLGPYLVSADEVGDPQELTLTLHVNGEEKQRSSTAAMIHTVAELVSYASHLMTLRPGDVILTGTPSGVGMASGTYLRPGDEVVAEVVGLGVLRTPIVAE